jgi:hypothetical protein
MDAIRRSRNSIAIAILFLVIGLGYLVLASSAGEEQLKWAAAGVTMLVALGAAMGLMAYVLIAGSPRD